MPSIKLIMASYYYEKYKEEAQLSQTDRAKLRVVTHFAKSLKVMGVRFSPNAVWVCRAEASRIVPDTLV